MACPDRLSQWTKEVSTTFAHLSKPQIWGLVLWSAGIALSGVAGINQISALLALVLQEQEQTVFQRLREWYLDAGQKSGKKRRDLEVSTCFAPLLGWVLRLWKSEKRQLPLVMDATSLGNRWTILAISVVMSSCAIPVAWKVIPAEQAGSWRPYWEGLLNELGKAVPEDVGSDRACGSGIVRPLALGRHCGVGLASVLTHQCGIESTFARRGKL